MSPTAPDALAALRDIHLPDAVAFWPPAPGWWIAGALVLGAAVASVAFARARRLRREAHWKTLGVRELEQLEEAFRVSGDAAALAAGLSTLLRRIALVRDARRRVAALHGDAWFAFLSADRDGDQVVAARTARELTHVAYQGVTDPGAQPERWVAFVRAWIAEAP